MWKARESQVICQGLMEVQGSCGPPFIGWCVRDWRSWRMAKSSFLTSVLIWKSLWSGDTHVRICVNPYKAISVLTICDVSVLRLPSPGLDMPGQELCAPQSSKSTPQRSKPPVLRAHWAQTAQRVWSYRGSPPFSPLVLFSECHTNRNICLLLFTRPLNTAL